MPYFFHWVSFVWQSLSILSSSFIKCFSVQFSTWSDFSDILTSSMCSVVIHLFCSCPSCFFLDCFLLGLLQSCQIGTSLCWHSGNFFHISWVLFFWIPCLPFGLFLHFGFLYYYYERLHGNVFWGDFIFIFTLDWLLRDFYIGNYFPQKFRGVPLLLGCSVDVSRFDLQKVVFWSTAWEIWTLSLNFSNSAKCFMSFCSLFPYYSILFLFHGIQHLLLLQGYYRFFDMLFYSLHCFWFLWLLFVLVSFCWRLSSYLCDP